MNANYSQPEMARCCDINRQVRQAERHQQMYYRAEPASQEKSTAIWKRVLKFAQAAAALLRIPIRKVYRPSSARA